LASLTSEEAEMLLLNVNPEHYFILASGKSIRNIEELASEISDISDEEFFFHVSEENNDFLNWIEYIIRDEALSKALKGQTKRKNIQNLIRKRVKELNSALKKKRKKAPKKDKKAEIILKKLKQHTKEYRASKPKKLKKVVLEPKKYDRKYYMHMAAAEFVQGLIIGILVGIVIARMLI